MDPTVSKVSAVIPVSAELLDDLRVPTQEEVDAADLAFGRRVRQAQATLAALQREQEEQHAAIEAARSRLDQLSPLVLDARMALQAALSGWSDG